MIGYLVAFTNRFKAAFYHPSSRPSRVSLVNFNNPEILNNRKNHESTYLRTEKNLIEILTLQQISQNTTENRYSGRINKSQNDPFFKYLNAPGGFRLRTPLTITNKRMAERVSLSSASIAYSRGAALGGRREGGEDLKDILSQSCFFQNNFIIYLSGTQEIRKRVPKSQSLMSS